MKVEKINLQLKRLLGQREKKVLVTLIFPFRNYFILFNLGKKAKNNHVNLNYWNESKNLGDMLSPVVVNHMLSLKNISPDKSVSTCRHLYAVGSILTAGLQDATVWGSGVLNASLTYRLQNRKLDIRAVRGPITCTILRDYGFEVPEIYGDPAIILPEIYPVLSKRKIAEFGLVIHKDYVLEKKEIPNNILRLDICTSDYKKFIDDLVSVNIIISSSLHGIILAEAYGIPAILLKPQIDVIKYYDYYYSTGRTNFVVANTIEEAMQMDPPPLPDTSTLRKNLKNSFPYDLYEN